MPQFLSFLIYRDCLVYHFRSISFLSEFVRQRKLSLSKPDRLFSRLLYTLYVFVRNLSGFIRFLLSIIFPLKIHPRGYLCVVPQYTLLCEHPVLSAKYVPINFCTFLSRKRTKMCTTYNRVGRKNVLRIDLA